MCASAEPYLCCILQNAVRSSDTQCHSTEAVYILLGMEKLFHLSPSNSLHQHLISPISPSPPPSPSRTVFVWLQNIIFMLCKLLKLLLLHCVNVL